MNNNDNNNRYILTAAIGFKSKLVITSVKDVLAVC